MKIKINKTDYTKWHKWFAWHPVRLEDSWVWLTYVERKFHADHFSSLAGIDGFWCYRGLETQEGE